MTEETQPSPSHTPALWAERVGTRMYVARNDRGGEVLVGPAEVDGTFTPGELLALALAVCSGMSADHRLAHHLGADFQAVLGVERRPVEEENRYGSFDVDIAVDLSGLGEEERSRVVERAARAVERGCTVGRTVKAGADYALAFSDRSAS